jgi:RecG-like helicase
VPFRRFFQRFTETDEERLAAEVRDWSESVPDTVRIGTCPTREPVRVAGTVRRITVRPGEGFDSLEALVSDGTGEVTAAWTGRRAIQGLSLGTRMILEGAVGEERGARKMVNPRYEFAQ